MTSFQVLDDTLTAAGAFASEALARLSPDLASRIATEPLSVIVRLVPACARLLVSAPSGDVACVFQAAGPDFPVALGKAAAECVTSGLARLSNPARRTVAALLEGQIGGGLGLIVELDAGTVHVTLDAGDLEPRVLATLAPGGAETTH